MLKHILNENDPSPLPSDNDVIVHLDSTFMLAIDRVNQKKKEITQQELEVRTRDAEREVKRAEREQKRADMLARWDAYDQAGKRAPGRIPKERRVILRISLDPTPDSQALSVDHDQDQPQTEPLPPDRTDMLRQLDEEQRRDDEEARRDHDMIEQLHHNATTPPELTQDELQNLVDSYDMM